MIQKPIKLSFLALLLPGMLYAQNVRKISLQEALDLGIANSKNLKLSQNKIDEAVQQLAIVKDNALPTASASFLYNHAQIPTNKLTIGGADPINLPKRANAFVGTAAVEELVYGGGKLKYAEESTRLLTEVARLDADKSKEEISYAVISTYYNLFKVLQSKKVVAQNLESIAGQLKQSQRFFDQGVVTKNDVLRFQLQQANISLTEMEIESNRKIINYNLDILLGLDENTEIEITDPSNDLKPAAPLNSYIEMAFGNRQELRQLDLQNKVADVNIKSIQANTRPTVGVGANLYYINPSGKFIPPAEQYIVPMTLGANISWNIGTLWTNKNKVTDARIQQKNVVIQKDIFSDQVKTEINKNYQDYQLATSKIRILETSIAQATENDNLLASKYKNNVASAIDRIDAETLLYQAKINLELAKADAGLAYYTLLKSTGKISQ
ncbi:TolC family protein [Pedobacter metabolipauper]|uniref:Outer membrane protein TolC n=1 Tax=Pedobacter metabolipauper TaxID=425513 RepID=A0A4R6SUV7_9SPHI|nr:TolC family protein [Pedobacter metabolipauper]TDQ09608.1 outer membrane protein TolC [Pedobacter metabolipauper]